MLHLLFDDQVSGGLNHLVPRNGGGAQWTWKKVTIAVDGSGGERGAEDNISRNIRRGNKGFQEWTNSLGQEESTSRIMGSKSCPSELLRTL